MIVFPFLVNTKSKKKIWSYCFKGYLFDYENVNLTSARMCETKHGLFSPELMASFVEDKKIKQDFKGKLVGAVLNGYLSLRR